MLAQEAPLIEQGAVQFILFGVTVIVIFIEIGRASCRERV